MASELIRQSLETLATCVGDPTAQVYARLFAAYPEAQALFVGDRTGAARGEMLAQAFDALLDLAEGGQQGGRLLAIERVNHEGLGVPPDLVAAFFPILAEVVRDGLGDAWTPEIGEAWEGLTERARRSTGV